MDRDTPSILVPYLPPNDSGSTMDVFFYLRPETNGVRTEGPFMKTIRDETNSIDKFELVYLANIPGKFILDNHIVETHYAVRLHFAAVGKEAFTGQMRSRFEAYFGVPFDRAKILGAFEALRELSMEPEELFSLWVDPADILILNGQTVKRTGDRFVVNYDIPALLHKNTWNTDIAVMVFRFAFSWSELRRLVRKITATLTEAGVLDPRKPPERVFHHSKGPFEQVLDAIGYLYEPDGKPVPLEDVSFCRYLTARGVPIERIRFAIENPIMRFETERGTVEENLFDRTMEHNYEEAYRKYLEIIGPAEYR